MIGRGCDLAFFLPLLATNPTWLLKAQLFLIHESRCDPTMQHTTSGRSEGRTARFCDSKRSWLIKTARSQSSPALLNCSDWTPPTQQTPGPSQTRILRILLEQKGNYRKETIRVSRSRCVPVQAEQDDCPTVLVRLIGWILVSVGQPVVQRLFFRGKTQLTWFSRYDLVFRTQ